MAESKRIEWLDIAKGIGVLLVMLGHLRIPFTLYLLIYSFHTPMFFFLAGYVFSVKKNFKDFLISKYKALIIPYFVFGFILIFYDFVFINNSTDNMIQSISNLILQRRYLVLWFLTVLFLVNIICYIIIKYIKKDYIQLLVIITIFIVGLIYNTFINKVLIWNIDAIPMVLIYFYAGYLFRAKNIELTFDKYINSKNKIAVLLILISIFVNCGLLSYLLTQDIYSIYSQSYGLAPFSVISVFLGIAIVIIISKNISCRFLSFLGVNSLVYYALHKELIYKAISTISTIQVSGFRLAVYYTCILVITIISILPIVFVYNKIKYRKRL